MSKVGTEVARANWACPGCNYPRPGQQAIDVIVEAPIPSGGPLNFTYGYGVPIAKREFLQGLGPAVSRDLFLGDVILDNGEKVTDWVTFRGRTRLIIRGTKHVSHRVCSACGRDIYFAMGNRYLFPTPRNGLSLFESDLFGLIVPDDYFGQLSLQKWRGLEIEKLRVASSPKDGFGELRP
jgi:hypothetical protein